MILGGVDLGGRKAAVSIFEDGKMTQVVSLEVPISYRARELRTLGEWCFGYLKVCNYVFVEEALIGRNVRSSLQVAQTAGAVMAGLGGILPIRSYYVEVKKWKKELIDNGNAGKEVVAQWLLMKHPAYAALCGSNQDRIDATCIGLYGVRVANRSVHLEDL